MGQEEMFKEGNSIYWALSLFDVAVIFGSPQATSRLRPKQASISFWQNKKIQASIHTHIKTCRYFFTNILETHLVPFRLDSIPQAEHKSEKVQGLFKV